MSGLLDVVDDPTRSLRLAEFAAEDRDRTAAEEAAKRGNRDFVQVYPKGWKRLQALMKTHPSAARIYAFLAEHIDGAVGAVVVSQDVMASELGIHVITVKRQTKLLEDEGALVRIRVGSGVYAYALDPAEVWRSWDQAKETAAFHAKTLVRKADRANGTVKRKLKLMLGEPELPLLEE